MFIISLNKRTFVYWLCSPIAWRCLSAPLWITCSTPFAFSSARVWSLKTCSLLDCVWAVSSSPLEHPPIKRNGMNNIHRYIFVIILSCAVMGWATCVMLSDGKTWSEERAQLFAVRWIYIDKWHVLSCKVFSNRVQSRLVPYLWFEQIMVVHPSHQILMR